MIEELPSIDGAEVTLRTVGKRVLRVAIWRNGAIDGGHPPILFFNGIGANIELVAPFAKRMAGRMFVTFDMPGVGGSPEPSVPYNAFTMTRTAARLLDQLGIDGPVDVMGVSWGGAMAQHFAMQYAGRTRRLVLLATSAGFIMVPGKVASLSKMADPRRYIDPSYMAKNFLTLYGGTEDGAAGHMRRIKPPTATGYVYQLLALTGWTSAFAAPFLLKAPTLILMGDRDNIVPVANGRILNAVIPNSHLEIIEGGGHLFVVSRANETIEHIERFLAAHDDDWRPEPSVDAKPRRSSRTKSRPLARMMLRRAHRAA